MINTAKGSSIRAVTLPSSTRAIGPAHLPLVVRRSAPRDRAPAHSRPSPATFNTTRKECSPSQRSRNATNSSPSVSGDISSTRLSGQPGEYGGAYRGNVLSRTVAADHGGPKLREKNER